MTSRKPFVLALLCSFSVYLIPIVGPHAAFLLGEALWSQLPRLRNPTWALADIAVAVALQTASFALFYWFWRRRSVMSVAALLAGAVAALVVVQFAYMVWLPAHFMIEAETAPEIGTWSEICSASDAVMQVIRTPARMPSGGWREVWLTDSHGAPSVLRMPGCARTSVSLPQPHMEPGGRVDFSIGLVQVVPGGLALVQRQDVPSGAATWFLLSTDTAQLQPLDLPAADASLAPVLSDDGSSVAWIAPIPGTGPPVLNQVHVRPVRGGAKESVLDLSSFGPASYQIVGLAPDRSSVLLWVSLPAKLLAATMDGRQQPAPSMPDQVRPQSQTTIVADRGVVAWDAYQEDDNYRIAWTLSAGSGVKKIPKGSSITAAAVDASGRFVAVSTTTTLNIGHVRDAVFVFRTSDGQEVFRRFLPTYSRTNVAFLDDAFFAYSEGATTRVLRVQ